MKRLYVLIVMMPAWVYAQNKLVIKVTAPMLKDGTEISLKQVPPFRSGISNNLEVTKIKHHSLTFNLQTRGGELYYLSVKGHGKGFFLQSGKANITIADSVLKEITVTDNLASVEYDQYGGEILKDSLIRLFFKSKDEYYNYVHSKNMDTVIAKSKEKKIDSIKTLVDKHALATCSIWIKEHPNSYINTRILYEQMEYMPEEDLKKIFMAMPADIKTNSWAKVIKYRIDSLFVGATAPDFSQTDTNGRQISLASFRSKYVLLDFWASWCVPCRQENPNVVRAMEKFKGRNFTVLSISLDSKRDAWIKAIKQDGLSWTHLSDLRAFENMISLKYYVSSIPSNYLIDPDGKVIAKNLHGEELNSTLDKLLK